MVFNQYTKIVTFYFMFKEGAVNGTLLLFYIVIVDSFRVPCSALRVDDSLLVSFRWLNEITTPAMDKCKIQISCLNDRYQDVSMFILQI